MIMILMTVLLLSVDLSLSIKVISTDKEKTLPEKEGYAEILNSSLREHSCFSLCGRFLTHQFTTHPDIKPYQVVVSIGKHYLLSGYTALPCDHIEPGCTRYNKDRARNAWKYKAVLGYSNHGDGNSFTYFPPWQPGQWNSVCVTANTSQGSFRIVINGENVTETSSYNGNYQDIDRNIFLMNNFYEGFSPAHGAITDVNIWSRELTDQEMLDWALCKKEVAPDVLSWSEAQLKIKLLTVREMDKNVVCFKQQTERKMMGFNLKKSFDETIKFCRSIGGEISVGRDELALTKIRQVHQDTCTADSPLIHSGYSDKTREGKWTDAVTGKPMVWLNWAPENPSNYTNKDCAFFNKTNGAFFDGFCSDVSCPVCDLPPGDQGFMMRGVCLQVPVDSLYVMKSPREFLGYIQSKILFSPRSRRWEIVEVHDSNNVLAFMLQNKETDFPIGIHRWNFTENCTDPGKEFRTLNLHANVDQPGHFCCGDGSCIKSKLVCNHFPECEDGTDEKNCTFLHIDGYGNDSERPPIEFVKGEIKLLDLLATFNILEVFEVNEVESTFDIYFILEIKWNDKDLNFEFLKDEEHQNFLTKDAKSKIWIPRIEFANTRKVIMASKDHEIFVQRKGSPVMDSDLDSLSVNELYAGRSNPLKMFIEERVIFSCSFENMKNFPFGSQKCSLTFQVFGAANNLTRITASQPRDKGRGDIGQYVIEGWSSSNEFNQETSKEMVQVTMVLRRKLQSIFMVTYLPTILMNMINQATNYISGEDKYSMIYTINITCMMVLASVYLSVSASLPTTSDIKPVEVWLIFNLAYPFLTILVNVLLQVGTIHH